MIWTLPRDAPFLNMMTWLILDTQQVPFTYILYIYSDKNDLYNVVNTTLLPTPNGM